MSKKTKNQKEKAMRVIYDIDLFYKDAEAAANPAYIAMFVKHLHYRCRVLTLGCDAAIDSLEHTCWTEDAFDKERIYFGQVDVSCQFQTGTTASTKALGQYNGKDVIQSIERQSLFEVAKKIKKQEIPADGLVVAVAQFGPHQWYSLNNRAFTTHHIANFAPLRVIPRLPQGEEKNRIQNLVTEMKFSTTKKCTQWPSQEEKNNLVNEGVIDASRPHNDIRIPLHDEVLDNGMDLW